MAKKKFLEENNEQIWPITRSDCVYTIDGQATINTIIDEIEDSLEDKQDKLIYKDTTIAYKRIERESSINSFEIEEDVIFCVIESLNLEEGKTYNAKVLVEYTTPMSLNEPESLVDNTILIELEGVAKKSEELSPLVGKDVISLSFLSYDHLDYLPEEIVIYDKVSLNSVDGPPFYAEDRALVAFAYDIRYIDIGLEENIESEVTDEFLETYKFVTKEEKINWNNKQDKIKNSVFIKQTPSPDTYDYNEINLVLNTLEDGLYIATNDLSFYDETTLLENGAELLNGKKECSFDIYAGHLFKYEKHENVDTTVYCYITNLTTGIECCLDKNGGIISIYAANGFMYLDDVEKMLQYEEVVLELYESDRTGTTVMGTSSKEYQFNNAGFLFNENEIYHVIFEDLDGKETEITGKAEDDGTFFGNTILAISEWNNPLTPETHLGSDGTSMIFNIDVKNSLEYNGFGKVTILKVEYVSTEFLETHRFVTEEEKANWNSKQDKEDANLNTENKTIVGAINEVKTNKVDKVEGKDLIDIDEINRLSNVDNYDDSEVRELIDDKADINKVEQVNSKVDLVASKVEENTLKIEEYAMIEESDIDLIIADLDNE